MPTATAPDSTWLIRVPLVFSGLVKELFRRLQVTSQKKLGQDYYLVQVPDPVVWTWPEALLLIPWRLPVHHSWPCDPQATRGFVEKAAQALFEKFSPAHPQTVQIGALDHGPAQRHQRALASNLRGRVLQVFPDLPVPKHDAEAQDPAALTLFCLVGREGLYAGLGSPRECGGFHPGGIKFIKQDDARFISRAGSKVAEALHHLLLHRPALAAGSHWLELGASPGGMTSELLARGWRVTALDRAPLDARLRGAAGLRFIKTDVAQYRTTEGERFDAILCDMNGEAGESMRQVTRLSTQLRKGGVIIFTMKLPGIQSLPEILTATQATAEMAFGAGLTLVAQTHLTYNRHEFTLFFEQLEEPPAPPEADHKPLTAPAPVRATPAGSRHARSADSRGPAPRSPRGSGRR